MNDFLLCHNDCFLRGVFVLLRPQLYGIDINAALQLLVKLLNGAANAGQIFLALVMRRFRCLQVLAKLIRFCPQSADLRLGSGLVRKSQLVPERMDLCLAALSLCRQRRDLRRFHSDRFFRRTQEQFLLRKQDIQFLSPRHLFRKCRDLHIHPLDLRRKKILLLLRRFCAIRQRDTRNQAVDLLGEYFFCCTDSSLQLLRFVAGFLCFILRSIVFCLGRLYIRLGRCALCKHSRMGMFYRTADGACHASSQATCHNAGLLPQERTLLDLVLPQ